MNTTLLSERLKLLRMERGLTQEKLGECLGVSKASISKYEKGAAIPSFQILIAISDYFDVSMDYLIGKSNSFKSDPEEDELISELTELFKEMNSEQRESILGFLKNIKENDLSYELHKIFDQLDESQSLKIIRLLLFLKNDFDI